MTRFIRVTMDGKQILLNDVHCEMLAKAIELVETHGINFPFELILRLQFGGRITSNTARNNIINIAVAFHLNPPTDLANYGQNWETSEAAVVTGLWKVIP